MKERGLGPLQSGGKVVVIGGGPGGAATAIALKQSGRALGRQVRVVVVEEKHFAGEQHYNQCAGVLSPPIAELVERDLGIPFPYHLAQRSITGYVLHTARRQIVLDGDTEPSLALRRVQFDAYMLDIAQQHGVEVQSARVTDLEFHADEVIVYTSSLPLQADVVVGAFGMDEGAAALFSRTVNYRPPATLSSIVTKYHPGEEGMAAFGDRIHAFLPPTPHIEFAAVTPKGNHLTINAAGATIDIELVRAFLSAPYVQSILPRIAEAGSLHLKDLHYFKGHFPRGLAHNFTGERFVMVGDAAGLVRAFKGKGVTSAIQTGTRAAQTILCQGISASAFQAYRTANRDITEDLPYGRAMRILTILASKLGLMDIALLAAARDPGLRQALFDAVSAHRSYQQVIRNGLTLASLRALTGALAQVIRSKER
ncbi:MAG: hypothetical protein AB1894_22805 [Chloroflexota bacterium]